MLKVNTKEGDNISETKIEKNSAYEGNLFVKKEEEKIATGIVFVPDIYDYHGNHFSKEVIKKAAYDFMMNEHRTIGVMHRNLWASLHLVESYIATEDMQINNKNIKQGSWIISVYVEDDDIWQDIKNGKLTGFSPCGLMYIEEED